MATPKDFINMEFPSLPQNVRFVRSAAAIFASRLDFTLDEIDEIKVATSEAVSNAVVHAYQGETGPVRVTFSVEDGALIIVVQDEGSGIEDVSWALEPANTTSPEEHMGLGLVFINEYMNDVVVQSKVGRGTQVKMIKRPAHASTSPPDGRPTGEPVRH